MKRRVDKKLARRLAKAAKNGLPALAALIRNLSPDDAQKVQTLLSMVSTLTSSRERAMSKIAMMGTLIGEGKAPAEPVARAKKRMDDAAKRGGFDGLVKATASRIKATKDRGKRAGIASALQAMIDELRALERQVGNF